MGWDSQNIFETVQNTKNFGGWNIFLSFRLQWIVFKNILIIHDIQDYFKKFYYVDRQTWIGHIPLRFCRWYTWKLYLTSRICFKRTKITMIIWFIFSLDITSTVAVLKPRIPDKLQIYQNWTGIDDGAIRLIYNRSLEGKKLYLITSHFLYIIVK